MNASHLAKLFALIALVATTSHAQSPADPWQYCTSAPVTVGPYVVGGTYCFPTLGEAEALMRQEGISYLDATSKSVEELATTILQEAKLTRRIY